jgi:hypothetical protein
MQPLLLGQGPGPVNVRFLLAISGRLICAHSLIPHSAKTYEFSARGASGEKRMSFPFLSWHLSVDFRRSRKTVELMTSLGQSPSETRELQADNDRP